VVKAEAGAGTELPRFAADEVDVVFRNTGCRLPPDPESQSRKWPETIALGIPEGCKTLAGG
jgi:hypothetical protein